jgi:hypothetical protein
MENNKNTLIKKSVLEFVLCPIQIMLFHNLLQLFVFGWKKGDTYSVGSLRKSWAPARQVIERLAISEGPNRAGVSLLSPDGKLTFSWISDSG